MASLEKLLQPSKVFSATFTQTADGLITFSNPNGDGLDTPYLDLSGIDWERIVVDLDVTAASGTNPTLDLKGKTINYPGGTAIGASTLNATDGGGTAFAMTQATAATREVKSLARKNADADGSGNANVGKYFALYGDIGGTDTPTFTGRVTVYAGK